MTKLIMTGTMFVLAASAAFAQATGNPGPYGPRGQVIYDGKVVGQDPDRSIQFQILREYNGRNGE
ncbi:MAG TPA: hypothetical protein VNL39_07040 [Xanthobacteraceae bacterium]|nr:hypothetical protein [Xanthobacteraceae bacterium]